jgi:hypothetical protein
MPTSSAGTSSDWRVKNRKPAPARTEATTARRGRAACGSRGRAAGVPAFEACGSGVDPAGEAAALLIFEELGAEHRRQAEREEAGKGDGADHRRGELAEQEAGLAGDEHDRHEHRADDERGRDDGEADLARAFEGGGERRLPFLDPVVDVFEHDDGVVDDDADRQHHGEQGEEVDREAEQPQHREAGEQAERHGDRRDQVARQLPRNR